MYGLGLWLEQDRLKLYKLLDLDIFQIHGNVLCLVPPVIPQTGPGLKQSCFIAAHKATAQSPGRRPRRAPGLCSAGVLTNGSSDV